VRPICGTVDAAASAIEKDAVGHNVEILFPLVHHIVAEQDLAEAWPVHLYARIAFIPLDCGRSTEDHRAPAASHHLGAHVAESRINSDGLFWYTGHGERRRHAIGGPRLLRAGLEQQTDLHRDHR